MANTSSFLSDDGITEATAAVLSARCVGSAAELRTNRSSFFSPAANADEHVAVAAAKTRSVCMCASCHFPSKDCVYDLLFPEPPHAGNGHFLWTFVV
jgi:hypothetical protein